MADKTYSDGQGGTLRLQQHFDHGLGDVVHYAALLQLYKKRGYDVIVHYEHNKRHVYEAAGIKYHPIPENYNAWRYYGGFNSPNPAEDWSGNKIGLNLNMDGLPDLGDRSALWDELCQVNLEDSFDPLVTPEHRAEAARWLEHLPRPIVLLHPRGVNFWREKSIPEDTTRELYRLLLDGNRARRPRWSVLEYPGDMPSAHEIARHALRMLAGPRYGCPIGRDVMIQQLVRDYLKASTSTSPIADRNNSMDFLLREMTRRFPDPVVVETGCQRAVDDWTAGASTTLFGAWMDGRKAGHLTSVDISPESCRTAREICRPWGDRVQVVESCSVKYLESRKEPIDVAYLDSMDIEVAGHEEHGLREAQAVLPLLREDSLVVYDDTVWSGGRWVGKGALGVPWLLSNGWRIVTAGYQAILARR